MVRDGFRPTVALRRRAGGGDELPFVASAASPASADPLQNGAASRSQTNGQPTEWQSWPLRADLELRAGDEAGVGALELFNATGRLSFGATNGGPGGSSTTVRIAMGSRCNRGLPSVPTTHRRAPRCAPVVARSSRPATACAPPVRRQRPPPPVSSLFRLFVFAKSRRWMMFLGLALTVAGNFVGLMTIYLTGPLDRQRAGSLAGRQRSYRPSGNGCI